MEFDLPDDAEPAVKRYSIAGCVVVEHVHRTLQGWGHVQLRVEPYPGPHHFCLDWQVPEDEVPSGYVPDVVRGIQDRGIDGVEGRWPVTNLRVTVIGGSQHEVDSNGWNYQAATRVALEKALLEAGLVEI